MSSNKCGLFQKVLVDYVCEKRREYFSSDAEFARAVFVDEEVPQQKWHRIKKGQPLSIEEICLIAEALHVELPHLIFDCHQISKQLKK